MPTLKFTAEYPDHYGKKVAKVEQVKNKLGMFKIGVFVTGKDWQQKTEYQIEVEYPGDGGNMTSTRKFSSVPEAITYAKKAIAEEVSKHEAEVREAKKSPKQKSTEKLRKKLQFFRDRGADLPTAKKLLRAEDIAEEKGWEFVWEDEPGDWNDFLGDQDKIEDIESVMDVVLKDENGRVLESMGGITFAKRSSTRDNQDYGRYLQAELALEAAGRLGLL
jgi:hypothetical protein